MVRRWFVEIAIRFLERDILAAIGAPAPLTKEQEDGMLAQLWESPAFHKRIADRDAKLIHVMAGAEGMQPEPRIAYAMHSGQRVENLLLARDAKAAHARVAARAKQKREAAEAMTTAQE